MVLSRTTPCQLLSIWAPRWKDRTVLLATYKVGFHNEIVFTKTPSMEGKYYISGEKARQFPVQTNGKLSCYCVKLDALEKLERA